MFGLKKTDDSAMSFEALESELLKGHRVFKAFENALEVAAAIKGIENAGREAEQRLSALKEEEAVLNQAKELAKSDLEAVKAKAAETVANAKAQANAMIAQAKQEANEVTMAASDELATINDAIEQARNELGQLRYKMTETEGEYNDLVKKLENAKKAIMSVA